MNISDWPLISIVILAIGLMLFALITFNWSWKRLPDHFIHPEEPQIVPRDRFPFLAGAYLLAGSVMVERILTLTTLFYQVKTQFLGSSKFMGDYSKFMGDYSVSVNLSTIIISVLWVVLGTWLILKKGWRTTALFGSMSTLIGACLSIFLYCKRI